MILEPPGLFSVPLAQCQRLDDLCVVVVFEPRPEGQQNLFGLLWCHSWAWLFSDGKSLANSFCI
jgi:hypothetical protein